MTQDLNPGLLKLDLLCKGIKIDPSCELDKDSRQLSRTRAGLGSGLEAILPDALYVNIPVLEHFVAKSPYTLIKEGPTYFIFRDGEKVCPIQLPKKPRFYDFKTSSGTLMSKVGVMQGTTLAIYPTKVCGYWEMEPRKNCRFCATGLNVGVTEEKEKRVEDVIETARAAKKEEGITFVHFNTGYYSGQALDIIEPYVRGVKRATGLLVGVQCPPQKDLTKYDRLLEAGADHFSFCFELHNPEIFKEVCPGKAETLGQETFYRALEYTSKIMGKGKNSGEIIAGIEPLEDTFKAIEYITSVGAFPTICVFRPTIGTDFEALPSPSFEDMVKVFQYMYEACKRHSIPTGIAPNIKTSLVILPYEGKYFRQKMALSDLTYSAKLVLLRILFRSYFHMKMAFS